MKLYIASDVRHAKRWINFRELAFPQIVVVSTWIDFLKDGEPKGIPEKVIEESWDNNIKDMILADAVILYHEPFDKLRGALFEAGMGFAMGKYTMYVGPSESLGTCGVCFGKFDSWDEAIFALQDMEAAKVVEYLRPRAN